MTSRVGIFLASCRSCLIDMSLFDIGVKKLEEMDPVKVRHGMEAYHQFKYDAFFVRCVMVTFVLETSL